MFETIFSFIAESERVIFRFLPNLQRFNKITKCVNEYIYMFINVYVIYVYVYIHMLYILYKCIYMSVIIIIEYSRPVTVMCYITYIYIYMCLMLMYLSNIFCLLCFVTFLCYFWCRWWFCYCFVIVLFTPILHFVNLIMVQFCYMANKIFCKDKFLSRINNKNTRLTQFIPVLRFI